MSRSPSPWIAALHVGAVGCFAFSQPLLDLLGRHPEFLVAHRVSGAGLVLLALGITLAPLVVALLTLAAAGRFSPRLAVGIAQVMLAILGAATAIPLIDKTFSGSVSFSIALSLCAGLGLALLYTTRRPVRQFLSLLSLTLVIFPLLFIFSSAGRELLAGESAAVGASPRVERPAPIVLLVFDEFPVISLLDRTGGIDPLRYPNFARLADDSIWFKNTSTVAIFTQAAVPAILTGRYPDSPFPLATYENLPRSIYTLLAGHYRIHNFETITQLCPSSSCATRERADADPRSLVSDLLILYLHLIAPADLSTRLPPVTENWKDFAGPEQSEDEEEPRPPHGGAERDVTADTIDKALSTQNDFQRFLGELAPEADDKPTLHVFHMLVPHPPWHYLPSGQRYPIARKMRYGARTRWSSDVWETVFGYQRHLLQVGFADRALGSLMRRLRELGLYDRALVVIAADHGGSFLPNQWRRLLSDENAAESLLVPLFFKLPGSQKTGIDERLFQTIDILPTIADVIGADIPWSVDGHSAFADDFPERRQITLVGDKRGAYRMYAAPLLAQREEALARKLDLFGHEPGNRGLYHIGPHRELIGRPISEIERTLEPSPVKVWIYGAKRFLDVALRGARLPTLVRGRFTGAEAEAGPKQAVVAINGRIAAVVPTYSDENGLASFAAMVPPRMLQEGKNRVAVFELLEFGSTIRLRPIDRFVR